ncbi:MAG TPA: 2-succinyl-5-enolpyruvyl-6-hydroxy-3-cyclohexene-1-carboxylic-acid synthase [Roseiflexaceae bacterium]|nr:2-succinyl-5-enolpyruvyl-6-hydroxy-3-cyclohexene-1-carboxylic-acid synthase [Roseiflexaceae bacterium]
MKSVESTIQHALSVSVGAFVDELARSGVRHFCVCPGSRSTPLALTIAREPTAKLWMHLDERSAGFFGLGLAKTLREPVALVCTSGTAAANFMPAVVEAFRARIPLIVLTADRPHELRDVGAPQTIDQVDLFGSHVKWFVDLAEPDAAPEMIRYMRTVAARAVATARRGPAGPVHINCPYREPLLPDRSVAAVAEGRPGDRPYVTISAGARAPDEALVAALASELRDMPRGLIICGPQEDPALAQAVSRLAAALGYPVLADPLSGLRLGGHDRTLVLDCYDAFLRDSTFIERFAPEVVLRFGAMPVSKPVLLYLQRYHGCRQIVVDGDAGWNEPTLLASDMIHADGRLLCEALLAALGHRDHRERILEHKLSVASMSPSTLRLRPSTSSGGTSGEPALRAGSVANISAWADAWRSADRRAREAIALRLSAMDELFEGKVFAELAALLPDGALLYAGNSMPIRDLDTFFPGGDHGVRLLANRGANGIDGVVSSALGAAAAGLGPTVLAIGDLSFYHDSNGLLAAMQHRLNLTIILLNNDGGGIFSFLPQAGEPEHFETLFGTPHGLDFRPLAQMYGAQYQRVEDWQAFRAAVQRGLETGGLHIVEVPTERARNVTLHREMWKIVTKALAGLSIHEEHEERE